ncbi:MAG TPA: glycerophosphodiester phosphodiesterase [Armatimonadetes bacterium]|nr:glycerophosphodiester phosphodiesterase [Armatimonadota bacterium]
MHRPYVVGHRGAAGLEPENTLRSFRRALELGVDYVECDVHLTRDGHLAVIHDETVDRTTNGQGRVAVFTLAELKRLDAGRGEHIPTLEEVLNLTRGRVGVLIELKGPHTAEPVVRTVKQLGMEEEVVLTSFHLERIRAAKTLEPHLRTGAIFGQPPSDAVAQALAVGAAGLGVHYRNLTRELVAAAHAAGLEVRAWNPDTEEEMQALLALGVDGISTNRPDLLLALLSERSAPSPSSGKE